MNVFSGLLIDGKGRTDWDGANVELRQTVGGDWRLLDAFWQEIESAQERGQQAVIRFRYKADALAVRNAQTGEVALQVTPLKGETPAQALFSTRQYETAAAAALFTRILCGDTLAVGSVGV